MAIARGRSTMALFSSPTDLDSHRVRYVLAEKGIGIEIISVDANDPPEDLIDLNPYQTVPTLVDRELVLYDSSVIVDYLDERYPHPPLMPVDPVSRARLRLAQFRILNDWYSLSWDLENGTPKKKEEARKELTQSLIASDELFKIGKFFLSDEMTLMDCVVAPFLWRLPHWGTEIPKKANGAAAYAERIFKSSSFRKSLTEPEREMRDDF